MDCDFPLGHTVVLVIHIRQGFNGSPSADSCGDEQLSIQTLLAHGCIIGELIF